MTVPSQKPPAYIELMSIYKSFLEALLDTAIFHGGLLVLGFKNENGKGWLRGDERKSFFKVGFEAHFVYRLAVFDSLLNSLTSLVLCHRPGTAVGDKEVKAGRLISTTRAQILSEYITNRVKQLSRESFSTRIIELERILKTDFGISAEEYAKLKTAAGARNKIVHEGSSFEFTLREDMSVRRREHQPNRVASKDWAYFEFIEPLALKITVAIAEVLFDSDIAERINRSGSQPLPDEDPDQAEIGDKRHEVYDRLISDIGVIETDTSSPTERGP